MLNPRIATLLARVQEKIRVLQHQKTALVTNVLGDEGFASNLGLEDLQFILSHGGEDMDPDALDE